MPKFETLFSKYDRLVLFDLQFRRKESLPGIKGHPGGNAETGGGWHIENG